MCNAHALMTAFKRILTYTDHFNRPHMLLKEYIMSHNGTVHTTTKEALIYKSAKHSCVPWIYPIYAMCMMLYNTILNYTHFENNS